MKEINTDIVILGGGIAGLWMLNTLTKLGYDALLLEADQIGNGQSVRSQGIIHGGIKYALNGVLSQASDAIKEMPERWQQCINGKGDVDLTGVTQLSDAHYLWSQHTLGAKITSFFAKKAMSGRVDSVAKKDYPDVFNHREFKGNLYKLNELVLDIPSVLHTLTAPVKQRLLHLDSKDACWKKDESGNITAIEFASLGVKLTAQRFIFAAGEGNGEILDQLDIKQPKMQIRPLHMVTATHTTHLPIYAHCIGASSKPLVTVTHHNNEDGTYTWYFGGDIAEKGLELSREEQIIKAQQLCQSLLPWVNLANAKWDTLRINRAEPKQSNLSRPDAAYLHSEKNYLVAWPTKLALAPDLSDKIIALFKQQSLSPKYRANLELLDQLHPPAVAKFAWSNH